MGLIINASLKKEDLDKLPNSAFFQGKTAKYLSLAIYVDDKLDNYGNNVSIQLAQSMEDRTAKKPKTYLGNGKVVYSRGDILTAKQLAERGTSTGSQSEPF